MGQLSKNIVFFSIIFLLAGFVSAGDKLVDGKWYSIKGHNDTWLSYDKESKRFILKNADSKSRLKAIKIEDNKFVFQLAPKEYLSASNDGTVTIRENPESWETFTIEDAPDQKYYLLSSHGKYLRTNYDIKQLDLSPHRQDWEAIEFIKENGDKLVDGEWYSIKADNDTWASYDKESKKFRLESAAFNSRFKAIKIEDNKFVFQLAPKEYLSASNDGTVTIRENPWDWERFTVEDAPDQKYYLLSSHGNYLRTNYDIKQLDLSPHRQDWEAIEFIKKAPQEKFHVMLEGGQLKLDQERARQDFLRDAKIVQSSKGLDRYDVNTTRKPLHSYQPYSPVVHTYHGPNALVPLAVVLPNASKWKLPREIINALKQYDIKTLDILFTPQEMVTDGASLKPAFWVFPHRPKLDDIFGEPPEFKKDVMMTIFDSDINIDDQVKTGIFEPFEVQLHDRKVSPDTGHLRIPGNKSFSFFSVVVFPEQKRAVVTLHWMLVRADRENLVQAIKNTMQHEDANFNKLLEDLDKKDNFKPLMKKLLDLVH